MSKNTSKKRHSHDYDLSGDMAKIREAFAETAKDVKGKATEVFSQSMEDVKDKSADLKENMETYVAEKPFKSLLLAMLSGAFIGGALMRRRKRANLRHRE